MEAHKAISLAKDRIAYIELELLKTVRRNNRFDVIPNRLFSKARFPEPKAYVTARITELENRFIQRQEEGISLQSTRKSIMESYRTPQKGPIHLESAFKEINNASSSAIPTVTQARR